MTYRGISGICSFTRMVMSLRDASDVAPGANAVLPFVAGNFLRPHRALSPARINIRSTPSDYGFLVKSIY